MSSDAITKPAEMCINGTLDAIINDMGFLTSLGVINSSQEAKVYDHIASDGYCPEIQGLQELTDWIRKLWVSYLQYNKLPPKILDQLSEDLPHISSNYIEYIKSNATLISASDAVSVNIDEFIELCNHVTRFFPQAPVAGILKDIRSLVTGLSATMDIQQVINGLYVQSKKLEYTSGLSEVLLRKVRAQINRIRLQLESVQTKTKSMSSGSGVDAKFRLFLQHEGITDTVCMIIDKLHQ